MIQKIRILYFDRRKPQDLLGKRDIPCTVHAYKPSDRSVNDEASNLSTLSSRVRSGTNTSLPPTNIALQETRRTNRKDSFSRLALPFFPGDPLVLAILTILGAMCAFILVLPTIPESESSFQTRIPSYLHMTSNSKVIASYILGKTSSPVHYSSTRAIVSPRTSHCHLHSAMKRIKNSRPHFV